MKFFFGHAQFPARPGSCYKLQCSTLQSRKDQPEQISQPMITTKYCFQNDQEHSQSAEVQCNPRASPKIDNNGRCICAAPYTGYNCEACVAGFKAE